MATVYTITNDRYAPDAFDATADQMREMCAEMGWNDVELTETVDKFGNDVIMDQNNEVVGTAADAQ